MMNSQVSLGRRVLRLAVCATVAGAGLASQVSHASTVVVDFTSNAFSTVPYNIDGFYLNVVTGATATATFAGYDINPYFSGSGTAAALFRFLTPSTGGTIAAGGIATPLAAGFTVNAASTFASGVVNANSAPGTNYFGFKFVNESTGLTNYGYFIVQQLANPPVAGSVRVLGYAYENTGQSVTVVPEPASVLMLMSGVGLVAWTTRRRAAGRK